MDTGPIFIGGLSFSGKTLLRLMLSAHPNIVITRRTYMWTRFYGRYGDLSQPDNFERCLSAMLSFKHIRILNPDPERIRREFRRGQPTYARLFALFHEHFAERLGKSRWGDQLGFVEKYVDPIFTAYPSAKMIQMVRDPIDRCKASLSSSSYRRGKVGYETAYWLRSARLARRNQHHYPDRYIVVIYENFISHPEETLREVCSFLNEEFDPAMLNRDGISGFGEGDGSHTIEGLDLEDFSISANQNNHHSLISERERAFVHVFAKKEMLAFGYPVDEFRFSAKDWLIYYSIDWPINMAGMAVRQAWGGKYK